MSRRGLLSAGYFLAVVLGAGWGAALAAPPPPTLFTIGAAKPGASSQGIEKSWPIEVSATGAMDAVFQGGMWLPDPEGGRVYAKYQRHVMHPNGTWTWIGSIATVHGDQSVVLTFGNGAVFGDIPQAAGGYPLQITTRHGQTSIVATNAEALAQSPAWLRMHSAPDYLIPPQAKVADDLPAARAATLPMPASAASPVTIDVMVAYSSGLVAAYGSESTLLTRIQFLVDWANQAYINSKVYQQLRLVHTVEVDYPDANSAQVALDDLTPGQTHTSAAAALQQIPALRDQYGADLVVLMRPSNDARGGGLGWLNGAGGTALSAQWGYAVDCDISSSAFPGAIDCPTLDFAHELGHNMGNAHDRATSAGDSDGAIANGGAYPYSYGYKNATEGLATIMAYADPGETYLQVFSNPDIMTCMNHPCGVPDSSSDSADNAHSMNNTAPIIAAFEPTMVATTPGGPMLSRNDVTGDGRSDLLWMNTGTNAFGYWAMDGAQTSGSWVAQVPPGYWVAATGDFNGDGKADLVWTSAAHDLYLWESDGTGFESHFIGTYPAGWQIVGAGDVDGDGKADLLWFNPQTSTFAYWIMDGATYVRGWAVAVATGWQIGATGDFNGDGRIDLVWENPSSPGNDLYLWLGTGTGFTTYDIGNYAAAGTLLGAGYVASNNWDNPELLFFNSQTNTFSYYDLYIGGGKAYYYSTWSAAVPVGYSIAAIGDFSGTGKTSLIWTSAARDLYLWDGVDPGFKSTYIGTYPAGWSIIPSQLMAAGTH